MAALEADRSPQRVSPEAGPQLPQLPTMVAPDNTTPQTIGQRLREKIKKIFGEGVVDHPGVAAVWWWLNWGDPVLGLPTTLTYGMLAERYGRPDIMVTLQYSRVDLLSKICGSKGLEVLVEHFATDISIAELERRRQNTPKSPSQRLKKAFSAKSLLLDVAEKPHQIQAEGPSTHIIYQLGLPRSQQDEVQAAAPDHGDHNSALAERGWALQHITRILLNKRWRAATEAQYDRTVVLRELAGQFETAPGRRINPNMSWQEMVGTMEMIKKSLAYEEAPEALEAMLDFFSHSTTGLADFIFYERREPLYPGGVPQEIFTILEKQMVDAAWGLVSVAQRTSMPEIRAARPDLISAAEARLKTIYSLWERAVTQYQLNKSSFTDSLKRAIEIIELADRRDIPPFTPNWLRIHFGAGQYQRIFTPEFDDGGEVTLRLHRDLTFLRSETDTVTTRDYPLLVVLVLRYPIHEDIKVVDGNGTVWVIHAQAVRERLVQNPPRIMTDEAVKAFVSLEGQASPAETKQMLASPQEQLIHDPSGPKYFLIDTAPERPTLVTEKAADGQSVQVYTG